ncbi:McKusick-Kaufman/Bardet-Biedl syndromes putative chaperonin [Latimeria chalumnae]|uniref:McKusick-Kaufman/Bardet-Biedl syndromes putative chaperonin n=1 Tax=Latimeria chalumnae TaxID=7897 RepID=UPI0002518E1F|nr:PREDICTED: McKusick-Kaufman/Bardet-Biedl syndromes putative chaperonin isoform X1 [Latimeria chalumnae]XP_014352754.1 PREDICTED: McKusick-Kaufman/Bardet-Biedl syndromes putative chaperonin isoform X1 [Latimeria chalumnae]|eukprot:XP_006010380.1 PREDICTED: McKusick-Kaufman/Bardet-Biedl syndromes putative chaperonin isoform X1 [Latimeria chalumnae]
MSRVEHKKPSLCSSAPLSNTAVSRALVSFHGIVKSCYGPTGRLKQIHNGMGGHICTTSQSSALLGSMTFTHPVLKLLIVSVLNHTSRFSDCGLFAAILCCSLIDNLQRTSIPSSLAIKVSKHLSTLCTEYLNSEDCGCRIPVDFSSSKTLFSLVRTVLASKPACMLTKKEADHISSVVLKAFLLTIPNEVGTHVFLGKNIIIPVEGQRVMDSTVLPGILVDAPGFHSGKAADRNKLHQGCIKLALFSVSLSGNLTDVGDGTLVVRLGVSLEAAVLEQLLLMGEQLVSNQVDLLVCQKVVHPSLRQYLKERHVMIVDRIGAALMESLINMTGAHPIGSFQTPIPSSCYGTLKDLRTVRFGSKQLLHLIPVDAAVCSTVLCNRNETTLNELKLVCQTAKHVLQLTLKEPLALLGGGCTETHLASFIRHKCNNITDNTLTALNCSWLEYRIIADCFCVSLESIAHSLEHDGGETLMDTVHGHCWSVKPDTPLSSGWKDVVCKCGCGMYNQQQNFCWTVLGSKHVSFRPKPWQEGTVVNFTEQLALDSFTAKLNALQVAVEVASLILELNYVIQDQN